MVRKSWIFCCTPSGWPKTAGDAATIVNLDGFILSHMIEPMMMPEKEEVDGICPLQSGPSLDPRQPITMGPVACPMSTRNQESHDEALKAAKPIIIDAWKTFGDQFGRYYSRWKPTRRKRRLPSDHHGEHLETAMTPSMSCAPRQVGGVGAPALVATVPAESSSMRSREPGRSA